jgi:hypothetical protein
MGSGLRGKKAMDICLADNRRQTLSRANAIVVLEGYVPTDFDRELDQGLISGRLTTDQALALIRKRAIELRKKKAVSKQNA